jgi:acyl transferase domain-containing protein/NADP-dependent 3-hydroxy acid dehydrogenase YdfG
MTAQNTPIAIVGLSAIFPGAPGLSGFWRDILSGADNISDVPESHWRIADHYDPDPTAPDKTYCKRGGFLRAVAFDPVSFGLPPASLPATDTSQLLALVAAKAALDDAQRMRKGKIDPDRISVVLGMAGTTELTGQMNSRQQRPVWLKAMREAGLPESDAKAIADRIAAHYPAWQEATFPGLLGNVVAGRIANRLNLGGANFVTDAACASSLSALQTALHELYLNEADLVLTGGADTLNDVLMYMCFSKTPAFSPTGDCRPFSDAADGTIIGEGFGMLALRRLADAERDGDAIYAVIRGLGASSDGRASSVYAPRPEGQAKALRRAYDAAGYAPRTVELVEAHGTATKAGDAAEFRGLVSVFDGGETDKQWCALGSVKSQIGHTKAAAGSAGLIKAALALQHKILPPTLKVERPNPALKIGESPFYLNTQARPWIRKTGQPRRAGVSSFGFGGSNFHCTLEEYAGSCAHAPRLRIYPTELMLLSAADDSGLEREIARTERQIADGASLAYLASSSHLAFDASHDVRLAIVAADVAELQKHLAKARGAMASGNESLALGPDIHLGRGAKDNGQTVFLFPGQGSQFTGMGGDLAMAFPQAREVWDRAAGLAEFADDPLHDLAFPRPAFEANERAAQDRRLTEMANAQPAIAAVSQSMLRLLAQLGVQADAFAGHSFGEVSALAAAGAIDENSWLQVARTRGKLMAQAAGASEGAMLAVSAGVREVASLLVGFADIVIANDNAPLQVVLAGTRAAIEAADAPLKAHGLTTHRLPVASAFHSPIVAAACEPFSAALGKYALALPGRPVYANATAAPYAGDAISVRSQLARQLSQTVRFREMILALHAQGATRFIEVGPGRALTGLVNPCLAGKPHRAIALNDKKAGQLRGWWRGLAELAAEGVKLDLAALTADALMPEAPVKPPAHAVMVSGSNLGKPYAAEISVPMLAQAKKVEAEIAPTVSALVASAAVALVPSQTPPAFMAPSAEAAMPAPELTASPAGDRLALIEAMRRETDAAHRHFQTVMAESHRAFLELAANTIAAIAGVAPHPAPAELSQPPRPPAAAIKEQPLAPKPVPPPEALGIAAPSLKPMDSISAVLSAVAEKTGYPRDMLDLDMEMEAGLGIDSIKQVEILAALQEQYPGAPEVEAAELASLKTLRDVVAKIEQLRAHAAPQMAEAAVASASPAQPSVAARPTDMIGLVMSVVAEKTGYPPDMLDLDMEMEAGLGIDSIKQVEILAALQETFPSAPEIDPAELASLKTLRDVVTKIQALAGHASQKGAAPRPFEDLANAGVTGLPDPGRACLRFVPRAIRARPSGLAMAGLDQPLLITAEAPELAQALALALQARGATARVVQDIPGDAPAIISLAACAPMVPGDGLAVHLNALRAAKAVAASAAVSKLFVTVQTTGGRFALDGNAGGGAWGAGVAGIAKCAALEWPGSAVKAIDVEDCANAAEAIAEELFLGGPEIETGLGADGSRWVIALEEDRSAPPVAAPLAAGDVCVVSGGARGVTAEAAALFAKTHRLRLVLLGRTRLEPWPEGIPLSDDAGILTSALAMRAKARGETPDLRRLRQAAQGLASQRQVQATLDRLADDGVTARYAAADIADAASVMAALDMVRAEWGPIAAIIHGAGILADKRIAELSETDFAAVFRTKAAGLNALLAATQSDPLRLIALFSSIAARAGNAGQAAYAAANEVLNKAAWKEQSRRSNACAVHSIGWGPWDGGMVDASLRAHFQKSGVALIPIEAGAAFFCAELRRRAETEVVAAAGRDWPLRPARAVISVTRAAYPFLSDHAVKGRIVIPTVLVLDWILRLALALKPMADMAADIEDLRILAGVALAPDDDGMQLTAECTPVKSGYDVKLTDATGRARYTARISYRIGVRKDGPAHMPTGGFETWPWSHEEAYSTLLFHGPSFASIDTLEGLSDEGGMALLRGCAALGWPMDGFVSDPAALDGGLQLALLWARAKKGMSVLPQRIAAFVAHAPAPEHAPLRCLFRATPQGERRIDVDFAFGLEDGTLIAELRGVEFYAAAL